MGHSTKIILLYLLFIGNVTAQQKNYTAHRLDGTAPLIDGRFDDRAWESMDWEGGFTQFEPVNGIEPSQKTAFKLSYDDDNIYVAIRNYDTEAGKIEKRLTRRDGNEGDICGIHLDSYYDRRTAFAFLVNAAGVKTDGIFTSDGDDYDDSLDPIWFVATSIQLDGWNVEMRIPLSQLRFGKGEDLTWGFQVLRTLYRKNELSLWQPISDQTAGWISKYGTLTGLKNLRPKRQIELAPYVRSKWDVYEKDIQNPFSDGLDFGLDVGMDAKIGVTNNLILDIAINPDFGQVEADPSEVNLSAFESYFQEKRPFFIEGTSITDYQITPGGNPWSSDNLFYSRRIGRSPQYYPDLQDGQYIQFPVQSQILGAMKLTGKTKKGWSVGIIESLVNHEVAELNVMGGGQLDRVVVEPMTNYLAGRLQKDYNQGETIIGGMLTATNRFIQNDELNFLPKASYTGGMDAMLFFDHKRYFVSGNLIASALFGTETAISDQQLSPRRYYQRPDADYLEYDDTKTVLYGHGGDFMFGRSAITGLRFLANVTWRSPGLELNDVGYLRRSDNVFEFVWCGYELRNPLKKVRKMQINANQWAGWDFGGTNLFLGMNLNISAEFDNFWHAFGNITYDFPSIENGELRGGPALHFPGSRNINLGFGTNSTKKMKFETSYNRAWSLSSNSLYNNWMSEISYRPIKTLSLNVQASVNTGSNNLQYVEQYNVENDPVYLFAHLNQKTFGLTLRADLNITPDFTLQYYASPFITAGLYDGYKKITDPAALQYFDRFDVFSQDALHHFVDATDGYNYYSLDTNGDQMPNIYFDNPDFNFKQFRSNLVARWEYIPGSVFYLVWAEGRTEGIVDGTFDYWNDLKNLFKIAPNDTFLIKLSHRFRIDSKYQNKK